MPDGGPQSVRAAHLARAMALVAEGRIPAPGSWLAANADLLARGGRMLDVACGSGRHALFLAAAGFQVRAVDRDATGLAALRAAGERLGLALLAEELDLESGKAALGEQDYDGIVVVHYLHRPLFRELARALKPGGLLVYETFTVQQATRGRPRSPHFLLEPGELPRLVAPLEVLRQREGEFEGCCVAGVVARRGPA